jgi:hypothetical protein
MECSLPLPMTTYSRSFLSRFNKKPPILNFPIVVYYDRRGVVPPQKRQQDHHPMIPFAV